MLLKPCALWGTFAGSVNALLGVAAGDNPSIIISLSTVVGVLAGGLVYLVRAVMSEHAKRLARIEQLLQQRDKATNQDETINPSPKPG
jgi:hypothetical protein